MQWSDFQRSPTYAIKGAKCETLWPHYSFLSLKWMPFQSEESKMSSLHFAVFLENSNVRDALLRHNIEIDLLNIENNTALFVAVKENLTESVEVLMSHGASCISLADTLQTPLTVAVASGNLQVVKLLAPCAKNEINKVNKFGLTALHYLAKNSAG